ncbi:MAG: hypothetical protein M3256_27585 [Actinomycetota bacterium]|nr:hypothetical protein [Actinomycetota bacterium]
MWEQWETALLDRDTTAVSQLVAPGPLRTGELYNCAWPLGGCVKESRPRPIESVRTVVPVQSAYPIYFLAEIQTSQYVDAGDGRSSLAPWVELQILTKAGPSTPWQMNFDSGYKGVNPTSPPLLPFDSQPLSPSDEPPGAAGGDVDNPRPGSSSPTPGSGFIGQLAAYWQHWKDDRSAPASSLFVNDGETSGFGAYLAQSPQNNIYRGSRQHYLFSADRAAGEWTFSGSGGLPVVCGTVLDSSTNTPVSAPSLLQNTSRSNWGMALPAGYYKRIDSKTIHETCIYEVPGGLDAAGNTDFDISSRGVRASGLAAGIPFPLNLILVALAIGMIIAMVILVQRHNRNRPLPYPWDPPPSWPPAGSSRWPPSPQPTWPQAPSQGWPPAPGGRPPTSDARPPSDPDRSPTEP